MPAAERRRLATLRRFGPALSIVAVGVIAVAVAAELVRPWAGAPIAFDTAASVVHFDRIISGQRLEGTLSTTPKPLISLVDGALYELTRSWAAISWATIIAFGVAVSLAAALAVRIEGLLAGLFVAVGLVASVPFLSDVAFSLAVVWAFVFWLLAGHAVAGDEPHWAAAGLALMIATLARVETLVVPLVAAAVLIAAALVARRRGDGPPRRAWLVVVIPLLALPIMSFHDWLLTGDPLYWSTVARTYARDTLLATPTVREVVAGLVERLVAAAGLVVLAAIGIVRMLIGRGRLVALGLVAIGGGVAAAMVVLAAAGGFVPDRYSLPVDLAVIVAAGIGLGGFTVGLRSNDPSDRPSGGLVGLVIGAALVGLAVPLSGGGLGSLDKDLRTMIRDQQGASRDMAAAQSPIRDALRTIPADVDGEVLLVPVDVRPRLALDLGLPLTRIGSTDPATLKPADGVPHPGQLVLHDRRADPTSPAYAPFETERPTVVGPILIRPVASDPAAGWWLTAIDGNG